MSSNSNVILLTQMPQRSGIRTPKDDWTGIVDRVERRKLQNRLNQRALRLRRRQVKRQQEQQQATEVPPPEPHDSSTSPSTGSQDEPKCSTWPPGMFQLMHQMEVAASRSYIECSPNLDHLISLPKINVKRASIQNICSIGMTFEWMLEDDSISIFNLQAPGFSQVNIPLDLQPTEVQKRVPHHPWFDFFPSPTLRDNLIALQDEFDDEDLCYDLVAFWDPKNTESGLLVWGPPWQTSSWEVTEAFLAKWGFLLYGCTTLLKSTNFWRVKRGEKPLIWKDYFVPHDPFVQQLKRRREIFLSTPHL